MTAIFSADETNIQVNSISPQHCYELPPTWLLVIVIVILIVIVIGIVLVIVIVIVTVFSGPIVIAVSKKKSSGYRPPVGVCSVASTARLRLLPPWLKASRQCGSNKLH